jgi:hypothetical protein
MCSIVGEGNFPGRVVGCFMAAQVIVEASWNVMAHVQKPDFVFGETDEST